MKKLMIVAAMICAAGVVQAAQVSWALAKDDPKTYANQSVYTVNGANYAAALLALENGTSLSSWITTYAVGSAASLNSRGGGGAVVDFGDGVSPSDLALFIFTDGAIATGKHYDTTGLLSTSGYVFTPPESKPKDLSLTVASFTTKGGVIGPSTPTPEPTSGLLILLGMAGLALRRRRV